VISAVSYQTRRLATGSLARVAHRRRNVFLTLVVLAVVLLFPALYGGDSYTMSIATEAVIYALVTLTLNLLVGFGGQISLGHAGLLAVGAYSAGLIVNHVSGFPLPLEVIAAGAVTAIVGFALGLPTGRLRGHYLAIATLGFGVAVPQIALNWSSLTGGRTGLFVNPPQIGGFTFGGPVSLYYATVVTVAVSILAIALIVRSSSGRAFAAVRDREDAASAMGVNVGRTKVSLFTTSAFFAGVAGALLAHLQGLVSPDAFPFSLSLFFLAAVVVGGLASVWGSLAAGALLSVVDSQTSGSNGLEPVIIGGTVVVLLLLSPGGLAELPRRAWREAEKLRGRRVADAPSANRGGPGDA
jgi:branched-chain amino acid transport system permease protein